MNISKTKIRQVAVITYEMKPEITLSTRVYTNDNDDYDVVSELPLSQ